MSLNILSDLDAWRDVAFTSGEVPGTWNLKPEAEAFVVYGALMVGMPDLTEATAEEWLTRLRAWEIVDGPMLSDTPVTMDHLRPYFGTRTNVFPKQTAAAFKRRVADAVISKAAYR